MLVPIVPKSSKPHLQLHSWSLHARLIHHGSHHGLHAGHVRPCTGPERNFPYGQVVKGGGAAQQLCNCVHAWRRRRPSTVSPQACPGNTPRYGRLEGAPGRGKMRSSTFAADPADIPSIPGSTAVARGRRIIPGIWPALTKNEGHVCGFALRTCETPQTLSGRIGLDTSSIETKTGHSSHCIIGRLRSDNPRA